MLYSLENISSPFYLSSYFKNSSFLVSIQNSGFHYDIFMHLCHCALLIPTPPPTLLCPLPLSLSFPVATLSYIETYTIHTHMSIDCSYGREGIMHFLGLCFFPPSVLHGMSASVKEPLCGTVYLFLASCMFGDQGPLLVEPSSPFSQAGSSSMNLFSVLYCV